MTNEFPSGPWTGYYQYRTGQRGTQDLVLTFEDGRMSGTGADELGVFRIEGSYNEASREADWLKSYPSGHLVQYRGFREGPVPGIWGTWKIPGSWSGGFHIWPVLSGSSTSREERTSEPMRIPRRALHGAGAED